MSGVRLVATIASAGICALYVVATLGLAQNVTANVAYARVAQEGRSVVRALRSGAVRPPLTKAPLLGTGSVESVRRELRGRFGSAAERVGREDRTLVLGEWQHRAVVVPMKDADEWDVVGAAALEVDAFDGWLTVLAIAGLAGLVALVQVTMAIRRLGEGDAAGGHLGAIGAVVAILLGSAAVILRARLEIADAAAVIGPAVVQARFDPTVLQLPNEAVSSIALFAVAVATAGALLAAAWVSSIRQSWVRRRDTVAAWSFLAPSAVHLVLFTAGPLLFTLWVSLHDWDLLRASKPFVGLANYREMVTDPLFWNALRNTVIYALYVPVTMALALGTALLLNRPTRTYRILRAMVFIPTVVSFAAIAIVWQWIFNGDYGVLNLALRSAGLDGVDWLGNPRTALVAVMIVSAWIQIGYQMVVYLAGLQGIPVSLYESAMLDGASAWQRFRRITIPMLRPTSVFLFITGVIWSFQVFTLVYVMTEGGPVHATDVLVYRIYQSAWEFRRMGYASAMSWFLFALLLALTITQWRMLNQRVEHAT